MKVTTSTIIYNNNFVVPSNVQAHLSFSNARPPSVSSSPLKRSLVEGLYPIELYCDIEHLTVRNFGEEDFLRDLFAWRLLSRFYPKNAKLKFTKLSNF